MVAAVIGGLNDTVESGIFDTIDKSGLITGIPFDIRSLQNGKLSVLAIKSAFMIWKEPSATLPVHILQKGREVPRKRGKDPAASFVQRRQDREEAR